MITPKAQAAIALLHDIYYRHSLDAKMESAHLPENIREELLGKFYAAGLIALNDPKKPKEITSYKPTRAPKYISLLDILEATGEHLNCNHPTTEEFYSRYGKAAQKLGVVNHMTRVYMQDIKLFDL